jgi:hypothetical protein
MAAIFVYIGVNLEPGLTKDSPIKWRHLMQTPRNGGKLKCLYRANPETESGECVTTMWGASPSGMVI